MARLRGSTRSVGHPSGGDIVPDERTRDRAAVRLAIAVDEYPLTVFWSAGLIAVLSFLNYLGEPSAPILLHVIDIAVVAAFLVIGFVLTRSGLPREAAPWLFALAATLLVCGLLYQVTISQTPLNFTYAVIVICVFGPSTLAWGPFWTSSAIMVVAAAWLTYTWQLGNRLDWALVAVSAVLISAVLLRLRLRTIDALADATALAQQLATTDQLSGLLNRRGLRDRAAGMWANAARLEQPVFVVFVDIRGLKRANDEFGHDFGDKAIRAAARAVEKSSRPGDLVARWGGDELVVLGIGSESDAVSFDGRLLEQHEWTGEDRARWAGELSAGYAFGCPADDALDHLIGLADEDMYRRRMSQ